MADTIYDPADLKDKPLAAKVMRGNLAVNKPERVTVTGYEAGVNGTGQPVLKLVCYPVGQPSFQEAIQITTDHLAPLMTAEQYDALEKQSMNSCDIDIELVKVAGFSLNPYRISKVLRGEIVVKKQEDKVEKAREVAGELAEIDTFLKDAPPVDEKPTCKNEWALDPKKLVAYQDRIEYIASEAGVGMKEARAWGLKWFNVPDETQIPMSASDALRFIKAQLPTSIDEQVEAAQEAEAAKQRHVEVTVKETKPVEKPIQTEASVIIFAKSDIYLTLPSGATVTLSVTLRDGADFGEVKRLIDVYTQMLSLPNVTTARPAPAAQPVAPAPQPAAPAQQQMAPANAPTNAGAPDPRGNMPGTKVSAPFAYVKRNDVNGKTEVELYPAKNDGTPGDFVMPGGYLKEKALALFPAAELAALQPGVLTPRAGILTAIVANKQSSKGYYYLNATHITLS